MENDTKQFLIRIFGVVLTITFSIMLILFTIAIYRGTAVIPENIRLQAWSSLMAVLVAASTALILYLNNVTDLANRRHSDRNAAITQAKVDQNAAETQNKVEDVVKILHNGLKDEISKNTANIVDDNAKRTAELLKENLQASDTAIASRQLVSTAETSATAKIVAADVTAQIVLLNAKLDALLNTQQQPVVMMQPQRQLEARTRTSDVADAVGVAVADAFAATIPPNTEAVKENTEITRLDTEARKAQH